MSQGQARGGADVRATTVGEPGRTANPYVHEPDDGPEGGPEGGPDHGGCRGPSGRLVSVSRVLNRPELVPDGTRARLLLAVEELGQRRTMRAFVPGMVERGRGRVVNFASMASMASMAGKDGNPNLSIYSASKAAVIALTKPSGKELATTGVLVNAIAPAVIATPMNDTTAPELLAHITSLIPMKRVGQPGEVAELVAWLASEKMSFSTGAVYDISGGRATY